MALFFYDGESRTIFQARNFNAYATVYRNTSMGRLKKQQISFRGWKEIIVVLHTEIGNIPTFETPAEVEAISGDVKTRLRDMSLIPWHPAKRVLWFSNSSHFSVTKSVIFC